MLRKKLFFRANPIPEARRRAPPSKPRSHTPVGNKTSVTRPRRALPNPGEPRAFNRHSQTARFQLANSSPPARLAPESQTATAGLPSLLGASDCARWVFGVAVPWKRRLVSRYWPCSETGMFDEARPDCVVRRRLCKANQSRPTSKPRSMRPNAGNTTCLRASVDFTDAGKRILPTTAGVPPTCE